MEPHHTARVSPDLVPPPGPCVGYVDRLPLAPEERRRLLIRAGTRGGADPRQATGVVHRALGTYVRDRTNPAYASLRRRLELAYGVPRTDAGPVITRDVQGRVRLATCPPIHRTSMAPRPWPLRSIWWRLSSVWRRRVQTNGQPLTSEEEAGKGRPTSVDRCSRWYRAGTFRRVVLLGLVLAQTGLATDFMTTVLPYHGTQPLEIAILILFAILFGWVSMGFWTAMAGFLLLLFGDGRYSISRTAAGDTPIDATARTAIVMPICNENVPRVFAGIRAMYESLSRTDALRHFDFFVLSDSSDPDARVAEIDAWLALCRAVDGFGRVFYRWRKHRIKRKSGNIADFCRRWGSNYRYMVVLDADSVMTGACLTQLVRLMEANPNAGIIQTAPLTVGHDSLFARLQQFGSRVYGPLFAAGLHFWQLGESYYWGHNAIIRLAPFIRHCALGRLPRRGTLSREILSHDFVEAALMRRAGWAVWLAYDLPGSYEEAPLNLVEELKRDRRWCQGNLINFRLLLAKSLHPVHRAVFATGVMVYASAALWLLFLVASTALVAVHTLIAPQYFLAPKQLFPLWPEWHPGWALSLASATATLLFLPKFLSVLLIWGNGVKHFGGPIRVAVSMLVELTFSALLAPVRMLFHTTFVIGGLLNCSLQWKSPARDTCETTWGEGLRRHGAGTVLGVVWAGVAYWLDPSYLWWLLPVLGALVLSIPISVYTSRVSVGRRLRAARFLLTPEEFEPPQELRRTRQYFERAGMPPGFIDAVVDPVTNALTCASGVVRAKQSAATSLERQRLERAALRGGPDALTARQKIMLLCDPLALSWLHFQVWTAADAHPAWIKARSSGALSACDLALTAMRSSDGRPRG
jgi:membrane glycosyltransferase